MKYTCWGAARQVTGSMHLLEIESDYRILIDCGLDYETQNNHDPNIRFPFEPSDIDVLILTHAHIDHSGNIPNLVKQGFKGEIFCTEPTAYLLDKLWIDSVNIQNANRKRNRGKAKLFGHKDIKDSLDQLLTFEFYKEFKLNDQLSFTFHEAGHILGAASVSLNYTYKGKSMKIGFTGDLGNYGSKLIVDPQPMHGLNYLISESTYGNRKHIVKRSAEEELKEYIIKTCVNSPGRLIIPAFSVGRTQAILFTLNKLFTSGEVPPIKVFADSPLALASTNIHNKFHSFLNVEAKAHLSEGAELFEFKSLNLIETASDVEEMEYHRDACIIVSSAGMLEGGRIQQHIAENIENPLCTILIAGFCSPGTLGAQLLMGNSSIRIKGKDRYVYARIAQTDVFSAHPDVDGLKKYIEDSISDQFTSLFLVHGEEQSMEDLKEEVSKELDLEVLIPERGKVFELTA